MNNLLNETLELVGDREVKWVGSTSWGWFTWDEFSKVARETEYDCGFGAAKIPSDLVVCGVDWWLERHEYDGSEWWELKELPERPGSHKPPNQLGGHYWPTMKDLHDPENTFNRLGERP